jgi:hypothetical protein
MRNRTAVTVRWPALVMVGMLVRSLRRCVGVGDDSLRAFMCA